MHSVFDIFYLTTTFDLIEREIRLFEVDSKSVLAYVKEPDTIPNDLSIIHELLVLQRDAIPDLFRNRPDIPENSQQRRILSDCINWAAKLSALNSIIENIHELNSDELGEWRHQLTQTINISELLSKITTKNQIYMLRKLVLCYNLYLEHIDSARNNSTFQKHCTEKFETIFLQIFKNQVNQQLPLINLFNELKAIRNTNTILFENGNAQWHAEMIIDSKNLLKRNDSYRIQKSAFNSITKLWKELEPFIKLNDIKWLETETREINHINSRKLSSLKSRITSFLTTCRSMFNQHKFICSIVPLFSFLYIAQLILFSTRFINNSKEILSNIQKLDNMRNNQTFSFDEKKYIEAALNLLLATVNSANPEEAYTKITNQVAFYDNINSYGPYIMISFLVNLLIFGILAASETFIPLKIPAWLTERKNELQSSQPEHIHINTLRN